MLFAGIAAAILFVSGCSKETPEKAAAEPTVEGNVIKFPADGKAPPLVSKVVALEPAPGIKLNGRVVWDEERTVRVFTPFAGRVARILVKPGDSVRQGQALAVLASPEFGQAQVEARRAETDVALAEKNLQRTKELESYGVAPRKDLQISEAEHARARAELDRARARLKLYGSSNTGVDQTFTMASPVAGVVVERNINPGQELRPDQMTSNAPPLFVITNPDYLWVILDASERELPHLPIGKAVSIRTPVYREEDFTARIAAVSDFLDPTTRTLKVRATLDNRHRRLKAEMFVTGEVQAKQALQTQVPTKAVFFQGGKHYVFTEDGKSQYTRREVHIGDESQGDVAILDGLQDGQRVVTEGALMLQQMLQPRRVQK
jgi:cobalt-zinc-cadmium efflux system membrane fusion protein